MTLSAGVLFTHKLVDFLKSKYSNIGNVAVQMPVFYLDADFFVRNLYSSGP